MARTFVNIAFNQSQALTDDIVRKVLIGDNYREINYNTEVVWKKGTGLMTAMQFIKLEYREGLLCVSGWIQIGLGSVGGREHDLTGITGVVAKKSVLKTIDRIKAAVASINR